MSQSLPMERHDRDLKGYSCLTCRQRKVKCDRRNPCSNCTKAEQQCSFIPPVRGKRRRTKPIKESLHAKLRRYEELLKSYGASVEPSEHCDDSDCETLSQSAVETIENGEPRSKSKSDPFGLEDNTPKLVTKEGTSRYFDSALWSNFGDQFHHPELGDAMEEANADESGLFFEPEPNYKFEDLANLHPPSEMLPEFKEIYIDRVDAMLKVVHIPTFWIALMKGLQDPQNMPKSLEALIFSFYLATVSTLRDEECLKMFGVRKIVLSSRYRVAARQALINAGFLSTSNPMTLQAYAMFMMCLRNTYRCDTMFVLSGVAIRLARKMGLHRDGTSLGLSPFETEIRRRLWWHLVHVDFRTADVLGTKPSLDLCSGDTKVPLNVEDEDLHPDMADLPAERNGITSITLCLIRCEIVETLRKFSTSCPGDVRWEVLSSRDVTLSKKDSVISQIEDSLESKYLRYCDPCIPLDTFASIMMRSAICKMRLFAHNPRHYATSPIKVPQKERDIVFANATKLLEYVTLMRSGKLGLEKYMWQIGTSFLWNTMLFVLIEARHQKTGPEVDKVWNLIGVVFSHYSQVFEESNGTVYTALGRWTLEVWDHYVAASKAEDLPEPSTPEYINEIRLYHRRTTMASASNNKDLAVGSRPIPRNSLAYDRVNSQTCEGVLPDFEPFESYDFPNLLCFETDPNEWVQWEQLVSQQGDFVQ